MDQQITEAWLASVGFKWHQLDRQPGKQWLLWLGGVIDGMFTGFEDLGIELAECKWEGTWSCWLRSDVAHRYSRFIHIRHLRTQDELIRLIEGVTGCEWKPANDLYGSIRTDKEAASIRREEQRLDQQFLRQGTKWLSIEEDDTAAGALPEHKDGYEKLVLRGGAQVPAK